MASEHDARAGAFYDHQLDEPSPRRRRVVDWGVGEDIFDRMPSRRFTRADRRAEHHEELDPIRVERRVSGPAPRRDDWAAEARRDEVAAGRAVTAAGAAHDAWVGEADARRDERADPPRRRARRPAESWTDDIPAIPAEEGRRPVRSWLEPEPGKELALAPGESRTIVLEAPVPEPEPEEPVGRRTVTITGHPDALPVPRAPRPPRTAVERLGHRPDRIVGYAVALGVLLVLIAVLTTGY